MARIEIKGGLIDNDTTVLVDGRKINGLKSLTLQVDDKGPNDATIEVDVDHIEVDAEAMAGLEAVLEEQNQEATVHGQDG